MDKCPLSFVHNSKTDMAAAKTAAEELEKWDKERRIG